MADPPLAEVPGIIPPLPFLSQCSSSSSSSCPPQSPHEESQAQTLTSTLDRWDFLRSPIKAGSSVVVKMDRSGEKPLEEHVVEWKEKKVKAGVPEMECDLPFLTNAPRMVRILYFLMVCEVLSTCSDHFRVFDD